MGCSQSKDATIVDHVTGAGKAVLAPIGQGIHQVKDAGKAVLAPIGQGIKTMQNFLDPSAALQTLQPLAANVGRKAHHVKNIFVKPLINLLDMDSFRPPFFEKSESARNFISSAVSKNFVFEGLSPRELKPLIDAFEKISAAVGEIIIKQGDSGDYFYIIETGSVDFLVDDNKVGSAQAGDCFGELALLYTAPRAATVQAASPATLYRVDQTSFRFILSKQTEKGLEEKTNLLEAVSFLKEVGKEEREKLAAAMVPKRFNEGDYIVHKGELAENFFIIKEGTVKATDISAGGKMYEDLTMHEGDHFGEGALMTGNGSVGNAVAVSDVLVFGIDKQTFETVLGKLSDLIIRSQDKLKIALVPAFAGSKLDPQILGALAWLVKDREFKSGTKINVEDQVADASLYLIRTGSVEIKSKNGKYNGVIRPGGYFGDEQMVADCKLTEIDATNPATTRPEYSATASEDCVIGVLTLQNCRKIVDTRILGKPPKIADSFTTQAMTGRELKRHKILGAGTFGQVWLVSRDASTGKRLSYALKVQSKWELVESGQAQAVVYEKNIMAKLSHPFLIRLVNSYQDDSYVYMVMQLVQGGELYNVIHKPDKEGVAESDARFYTAVIAEGLGYMHRLRYVYRDLKPENVLVNENGYPVIIDFGFAKYITFKTYTLCGTPLYLAPEVILNRGHNWGADHWSLGVMLYEMHTGQVPFYEQGMQQMELFRAIVKGKFDMPGNIAAPARDLLNGFLTREPSLRLGSLAGGEDDIVAHEWFKDIDFNRLRAQKIKAPYVPHIKDPLDGSNFEDWSHLEDKTKKKFPKLNRTDAAIFEEF